MMTTEDRAREKNCEGVKLALGWPDTVRVEVPARATCRAVAIEAKKKETNVTAAARLILDAPQSCTTSASPESPNRAIVLYTYSQ